MIISASGPVRSINRLLPNLSPFPAVLCFRYRSTTVAAFPELSPSTVEVSVVYFSIRNRTYPPFSSAVVEVPWQPVSALGALLRCLDLSFRLLLSVGV